MAATHAVYFSNEKIQVLSGNPGKQDISVSGALELPLPEGAVINGVVIEEAPVKAAIGQLASRGIRQVRMVLDSSLILMKLADVPLLPQKKLLQIVRQELADVGASYEDLIYDYAVVRPSNEKGGASVLCCAMERKLLDGYMEFFEEAGIKVTGVDVSLNAVNKLAEMIPELKSKTYILTVLDGNNISSILYENGIYTFSNRSRLFAQRGTPEFSTELSDKISSLIQFSKSQKSPYTISTAYFCGLGGENGVTLCNEIGLALGIEAMPLPDFGVFRIAIGATAHCKLADFPYTAGCLIRK